MQFCGISFILLLFLKASLYLCFTAPPVDDCSSDADCENNDNGKTVCDTGVSDKCKGNSLLRNHIRISINMLSIV